MILKFGVKHDSIFLNLNFIGLGLWLQSQLMLSNDMARDGGHAMPSGETGYLVQPPEHPYSCLAAFFQLECGS